MARYHAEEVWSFSTKRFRVVLEIERVHGYRYDGDDEDGSTQAALDSGDLIAFDSAVHVYLDDESEPIASDYLSGSVYYSGKLSEFWTVHRDRDPMNRNCSIMRSKHPSGPRVSICHYFPEMVRTAVRAARDGILARSDLPRVRASADR